MSTTAKVALVGGVFLLSFCSVLAYAGVDWFGDQLTELRDRAPAVVAEAQTFGRSTTQEGCVDETVSRLRGCDGLPCQAEVVAFMQACLPVSDPTSGFCSGVPTPDRMMATVGWAVDQCEARGLADPDCPRTLRRVQDFCHPDG